MTTKPKAFAAVPLLLILLWGGFAYAASLDYSILKTRNMECYPIDNDSVFEEFTLEGELLPDDANYFRLQANYTLATTGEVKSHKKILPVTILKTLLDGKDPVFVYETIPGVDEDEGYQITLAIHPRDSKVAGRRGYVRIQKIKEYDEKQKPIFVQVLDVYDEAVKITCLTVRKEGSAK